MRASHGLKRSIMHSKLSLIALSILFDSLIKVILLYCAPIWAPNSSIIKTVTKSLVCGDNTSGKLLKTLSRSEQEKVHLSFLKWELGPACT